MGQYFKLLRGQKRVAEINLIETAEVVIAGAFPQRYVPKNIKQNVVIVACVSAIEHPSVSDAETQLENLTKSLWEL